MAKTAGWVAGQGTSLLVEAVHTVTGSPPRSRKVWTFPHRVHVQLCGEGDPKRVERTVEKHPKVEWARVNLPLQRMIIQLGDPAPSVDELVDLVGRADRADPEEDGSPPVRVMVGTDVTGLIATGMEWALNHAPIPAELAGVVSLADNLPRLRAVVQQAIPGIRAERWLPVFSAAVQGLAPGGAGLAVDLTQRVWQLRHERAETTAWEAAEPELTGTPDLARSTETSSIAERAAPLRAGPIEHYTDHAAIGAAAGAVAGGVLTRDPRRALQVGFAASPKAAIKGRELFVTELAVQLSERGIVVTDIDALRRLDRIGALVLDARALRSDRLSIGDVVPSPDVDHAELATHLYELFDPDHPVKRQQAGGWTLAELDDLTLTGRTGKRDAAKLTKNGALHVLGLAKDRRLHAVAAVVRKPAAELEAIATAARRSELSVETTEDPRELILRLQENGTGVMVLSSDPAALAASDCGVGLTPNDQGPPWGAHVLVGREPAKAVTIVEAAGAARKVSERAVLLAKSGSGVGALFGLTGAAQRSAGQVMTSVNGAAALAMFDGVWQARAVCNRHAAPTAPDTPWHAMPAPAVLERLRASTDGLTSAEARDRGRPDRTSAPRTPSLIRSMGAELDNPLTPILAAGAAGTAAVGSFVDAALVGGVMVLSAFVGGLQRRATDQTIAEISPRTATVATVLRDGEQASVPADRLVPGDVVVLGAGDVVPADCRLLEADGLETDESSLTGESLPVSKTTDPVFAEHVAERRSMLYEQTTIAAGKAVAVVVATGDATETGRALAATAEEAPPSGVEKRLESITRATTPIAIGSAIGVTLSGLSRGGPLRQALGEGINLAVASVPEGLPLLVSAAQLASTRRLATRGVYVRNPRTIEALGRVDVLCFDKTGTLTEGEIQLTKVCDDSHSAAVDELDEPLQGVLRIAVRATPRAENGEHSHVTDSAVDTGAEAVGVRRRNGRHKWKELDALPFEPSRGYHATLGEAGGDRTICVKGAPEIVLPRCDLSAQARRKVERQVEELAASGHRVLAVAEVPAANGADSIDDEQVASLRYAGLLGLADVVRDTAGPAIAKLREAGVHIVMLTGDHPSTAGAIASTVTDQDQQHVITGMEIDELDDEALAAALDSADVVARCTPAHKVRVVRALRKRGRTVAMTGDGANDAAGIRLADVGIALSGPGTEAAQAAADLVVADNRLGTIVSALVEGRAMWASVREALAILVGGNLGEIGFTLLGSLAVGRSPLSARQLLLVNMLTDLAPALAIAVRAPSKDSAAQLIGEGPETSLGSALTKDIAHRAVVTALGAGAGWTAARWTGPAGRARTVGLVALVGTQLAQTLLAGGRDRTVLLSALGSAAVLAAIVQTPVVSGFFGCVPLDPIAWATALGAVVAAVLAGKTLPALPVKLGRRRTDGGTDPGT